MKKQVLTLVIVLSLLILTVNGTHNVEVVNANPISRPSVPDINISYPLTSIDGYVNSTVEFKVYVNMFIDSSTLDSISYSLDGQPQGSLEDLQVASYNDYVYTASGIENINFKTYTAHLILEDLSEGTHTLVAYAVNMSVSTSFTVNSHCVIAALKTLSPASQTYFEDAIPLTFNTNGEIASAHYYVYKNNVLVSENTLSGNTTIENLPEGDYELLLFVTTQHGQTSETVYFSVSNSNPLENLPLVAGVTIPIVVGIIGGLVLIKKRKKSIDQI